MLKQEQALRRQVVEIISTEELVPKEHLLRKIDAAVDFTRLYDIVGDLYCPDNGRPRVDPVVLFKIVLIQHLFGMPSLRRTAAEIQVNIACRWFLGYPFNDEIPHFSTVSYNFRNRFSEQTVEDVFRRILYEANQAGYIKPETVYIDGTHIKANANINKKIKKQVPAAAARYREELMEEVGRDREEHGKPPLDGGDSKPMEKEATVSAADPESGLFHKGEHKMCFACEAHIPPATITASCWMWRQRPGTFMTAWRFIHCMTGSKRTFRRWRRSLPIQPAKRRISASASLTTTRFFPPPASVP